MTVLRRATCRCGAPAVTCSGEPARVSVCHCLACKQRTGSAFSYNATFARNQAETVGTASSFSRTSEDGYWARDAFCPSCGSTVWYEIQRRPEMITVPVGAFADSSFPEPTVSVYGERRHSWVKIDTAHPVQEA